MAGWMMDVIRRPPAQIEPLLRDALETARALGNLPLLGMVLRALGLFRSRTGHDDEARAYLTETVKIFETLRSAFHLARANHTLAMIEFDAGNVEEAVRLGTLSLTATLNLGVAAYVTKSRNMLAEYLIAANRWDDARSHAREALDLVSETQQADVIVWSLHHLAAVGALATSTPEQTPKRHRTAALLLGYVDENLPLLGRPRHWDEQREYDRILAALQSAVATDELAGLMAIGATLTADAAVAHARTI